MKAKGYQLSALDLVPFADLKEDTFSLMFELLFRGSRFSPAWQLVFHTQHLRLIESLEKSVVSRSYIHHIEYFLIGGVPGSF